MRGPAAGALAKKPGGARRRAAGAAAGIPPPPPPISVRIGGRPSHGYAAWIPPGRGGPPDPDNPYASVPGGGDEEAARLVEAGGVLGIGGDTKNAEKCFKLVLARFPDHYIANYSMGNLLRLEGKPRRGIKYLKRAIRVWPENRTAHAGLGRALLDMGEYERAIRALDRALRIQPDDPLALKDREEALEGLEAAGGGRPRGRGRAEGSGHPSAASRQAQ